MLFFLSIFSSIKIHPKESNVISILQISKSTCMSLIYCKSAACNEREKMEQELSRKDELTVNLMNEIELLKEEKTEIQACSST